MKKVSRRQMLKGLGYSGAVLAGAGGPGIAPAIAQAARPFAGQSIVHWSFLSPDGKSPREVAIREIEGKFRERTGMNVAFQTMPWQELGSRLIAAVRAGSPPDVSRVTSFHLKQVVRSDSLVNLDAFIAKTFSEADRADFIVDYSPNLIVKGSKWSMQIEQVPKALYIRKDWLAEANLKAPRTWDELVEVAKAFTRGGRWGYAFNGSKTQLNQVETIFQPHIHGRGGQILDASEQATFNDDASVRSYQFLVDCVHKHKVTPQQVIGMTYDELTDAFKAGRVGMIQEGAHRYGDIVKAIGADKIELAKMPSDDPAKPSPSIITGWGMGIPVGAKNPGAAWEYIHNYISAEALEINARVAGMLPTRKSVLSQPFFQAPEADYLRWWMDYVAERSEHVINIATFAQLNEAMVDALHEVLLNPSSNVKQVLEGAVKRYNQSIRG
jgi:multiple sugar transport system substrate-binding protein